MGDEGFEAVVYGVAAFLASDLHEADHLFDLALSEAGLDPGIDAKCFGGKDPAIGVGSGKKSLADDGL